MEGSGSALAVGELRARAELLAKEADSWFDSDVWTVHGFASDVDEFAKDVVALIDQYVVLAAQLEMRGGVRELAKREHSQRKTAEAHLAAALGLIRSLSFAATAYLRGTAGDQTREILQTVLADVKAEAARLERSESARPKDNPGDASVLVGETE